MRQTLYFLFLLLTLNQQAFADLLVNGSFETPDVASNSWSTFSGSIDGWQLDSQGIEIRDNVVGTAYEGNQFAELDVSGNSSIYQTITTTSGQKYELSFAYSPRINIASNTNNIQIYWNGSLLDDITGTGSSSHVWQIHTFVVEGTGSDELRFSAAGNSDSLGGSLDDVTLETVPNPVLHLQSDESSWDGTTGEVEDSSGYGHDGTSFNGLNTDDADPAISGDPGSCGYGEFDGSDDYIEIPHHDDLNGSDALTYMAWAKADQWNGIRQIMAKSVHGGGSGRAQMGIFSEGGVLKGRAETESGRLEVTASLPSIGDWHHIALVYSDTSLELFIDGSSAASTTFSSRLLKITSDPINISKRVGTNQYFFDGLIDEVRIYTDVLTATQIQAAMNETHSCPSPPSLSASAYFTFDESSWNGTANEVIDESGNNNHGVAIGDADTVTDGKICRGGDIPLNTTDTEQDAIDTGIDIDDDIGNAGAINFWYRSNNNWNSGGDRALFDASPDNLSPTHSNKFFLLQLKNNGAIQFAVEDNHESDFIFSTSSQSFAANEWVHIAATWDMSGNRQIYINGSLAATDTRSTSGHIGELTTLYMGDNRSSYHYGGTTNSANGVIDEVRIYKQVLTQTEIQTDMNATHPCSTLFDHFELNYSANGLTCLTSAITLKACANADCSALYTEDINVTLDPASGWVSNPVTVSSGTASLELQHTTAEDVVVDITASSASPTGALQCFANNVADPRCTITFSEAGFVFDIPVQTACKPSVDVTIAAVKKSNITDQCVGALTGTQSVKFWSTYSSPVTGTEAVSISGTAIDTSSPGTSVDLDFDIYGEANFTVQYDDAGQLQIDAKHTTASDLVLTGNDQFVSSPVMLTVYTDDNNYECVSGDASCNRFKKAGESFDLNVNAACWEDDADTDFSDNPVTPNFELNSIAVIPSLVAPSGGSNGSLDVASFNFSTSDNGSHVISQAISEVGVFTFALSPPSYFGETLTTDSSDNIGRFYPDHFEVSSQSDGSFGDNSCGTFTYSGQNFSYTTNPQLTITAYNAADTAAVTQNYSGDFIKLVASDFALTGPTTDAVQLGVDNTNLVQLDWTAAVASLTDNSNGSVTFISGDDIYKYEHVANSRIAHFSNAADLVFSQIKDGDDVLTQGLPISLRSSGEPIRFGRLLINNAHGSELIPLPVTIQVEYFNGVNWQLNTADQCTSLNLLTHFDLTNNETSGGSFTSTMNIDAGTTTPTLSNNSPMVSGSSTMTFSSPGEENQGYVDIQSQLAANSDWLLGDFDNDGGYDDEASARASFGLFKDSDNIIFRQERY